MDINEKLKYRRKELGLTMLDVAKKVGVSEGTISRWESGDIANMRRDKIVLLANALDVTPAFIMGWEDTNDNATSINVSPHEQTVITQYRAKPHLQEAVDKLLDVPPEDAHPIFYGEIAAEGGKINRSIRRTETTLHITEPDPLDEVSKDIARELENITGKKRKTTILK